MEDDGGSALAAAAKDEAPSITTAAAAPTIQDSTTPPATAADQTHATNPTNNTTTATGSVTRPAARQNTEQEERFAKRRARVQAMLQEERRKKQEAQQAAAKAEGKLLRSAAAAAAARAVETTTTAAAAAGHQQIDATTANAAAGTTDKASRSADKGTSSSTTTTTSSSNPLAEVKQDIAAKRDIIDDAREDAEERVTAVTVSRRHDERIRRRDAEQKRDQRVKDINDALKQGAETNAKLEAQWEVIAKKNIPQELYQGMSKQFKAAMELLQGKEGIIRKLQDELKQRDEEFIEVLTVHEEDVRAVTQHMGEQFASFFNVCRQQLVEMEGIFKQDRASFLTRHARSVDGIFAQRRDMELAVVETRKDRDIRFYEELERMRAQDQEDFSTLKISLENNIQLLEQQLEEMRSTYQLNSEKLEYNHAVLEERDAENKEMVENLRIKLRHLKEQRATVVSKFHKQNEKYMRENSKLTAGFRASTDRFKDLQRKLKHFELVDEQKYNEVWAMNEESVMEVVRKVLTADKLVAEQVLGLKWLPPVAASTVVTNSQQLMSDYEEAAAAAAARNGEGGDKSGSDTQTAAAEAAAKAATTAAATIETDGHGQVVDIDQITSAQIFAAVTLANHEQARGAAAVTAAAAAASEKEALLAATSSAGAQPSSAAATPSASASGRRNSILSPTASAAAATAAAAVAGATNAADAALLIAKTGKYTASQVRHVITLLAAESQFLLDSDVYEKIRNMSDEEASLYKSDAVLKALGVEDRQDLDELVSFFFDDPSSELPNTHPNDVVRATRRFVRQRREQAGKGKKAANVDSVAAEKRARRAKQEREFWGCLKNVISEETGERWSALETELRRYGELLEDRAKLVEETTSLAKQNQELKALLKEYLGSDINRELQIPPTRMIRVE